ncbi:MAG TPA: four helix bundle protein [Bacteroidales bacterium]|nr:four helix bundle protein [Bacteroidales bacterium]
MFDFKKLIVYNKAKMFANETNNLISKNNFDRHINDQLKRASFSIMLNIAEGSSRFSNKDRKNFLVIARGSAFECSAIFDFLYDNKLISEVEFKNSNDNLEEISKMLFALIKGLE